jgi:putative flippase GtrA
MTPGRRPVVFTLVGMLGYLVQSMALWGLVGFARMPVVPATLAATELAVLHNFAWHVRWTWADRPAGTPAVAAARLVRFNVANGGVSLVLGAVLMSTFVQALGMHYLLANLLTVLVSAVANYAAGDRWVFVPSTR